MLDMMLNQLVAFSISLCVKQVPSWCLWYGMLVTWGFGSTEMWIQIWGVSLPYMIALFALSPSVAGSQFTSGGWWWDSTGSTSEHVCQMITSLWIDVSLLGLKHRGEQSTFCLSRFSHIPCSHIPIKKNFQSFVVWLPLTGVELNGWRLSTCCLVDLFWISGSFTPKFQGHKFLNSYPECVGGFSKVCVF